MQETWNQDWTDWLELISQQDLYVHNIWTLQLFKCESPHPPYSHEQLSQHPEDNDFKATALAESFCPFSPTSVTCPTRSRMPSLT